MGKIRSVGLLICLLMLLMGYLKQVIPKGKTSALMKAVISIFILLSLIQGIKALDIDRLENFFEKNLLQDENLWENAQGLIENGLEEEFQRFLDEEKIEAEILEIFVEGEVEDFYISKVRIRGKDDFAAKLISGRYQIDMEMIEVVDE